MEVSNISENKVKISVIVPVFQAEQYLECCINSILYQTFPLFEVILIDDGSNDNSGRICDKYEKKDCRVRVIHKKNEGVCIARNIGLELARGEWISFVDADDFLLPDSLMQLYKCGIETDADIVQGNALRLFDNNAKMLFCLQKNSFSNVIESIQHFALWGYLFKKDTISKNRFIEGLAYSEDQIFILDVAYRSEKLSTIPSLVYVYRCNDNSVCASTNGIRKAKHQFRSANILLEKSLNKPIRVSTIYKRNAKGNIKMGVYSALLLSNINKCDLSKLYFKYFTPSYSNKLLLIRLFYLYSIKILVKKYGQNLKKRNNIFR